MVADVMAEPLLEPRCVSGLRAALRESQVEHVNGIALSYFDSRWPTISSAE